MRRGLWFAAGAGTAVWGMVRGRRIAESFTADGLRDRAAALGLGARMFRDEVASARAEKETELRDRLGLAPHGTPGLAAPRPPALAPSTPVPVHDTIHDPVEEGST
jgi:Family of unknown function (DUF6167)